MKISVVAADGLVVVAVDAVTVVNVVVIFVITRTLAP